LKTIQSCAFSQCEQLKAVRIPTTATYLHAVAFWGCRNIRVVTLPESTVRCPPSTFTHCGLLQTLVVYTSKNPTPDPPLTEARSKWLKESAPWCYPLYWQELSHRLPFLTRANAPDCVISQLGGVFEPYKTFADLPPAHRVSSTGEPFPRDELYLWWTPTWPNNRRPTANRRKLVRTLLTLALRTRNQNIADLIKNQTPLPSYVDMYVWFLILRFVPHEQMML
jgi:hypothetical protein